MHAIISVEEHTTVNGFGSAVREVIADAGYGGLSFYKFGIDDCYPSIVGDQMFLRKHFGLLGRQIVDKFLTKFKKK